MVCLGRTKYHFHGWTGERLQTMIKISLLETGSMALLNMARSENHHMNNIPVPRSFPVFVIFCLSTRTPGLIVRHV